MRNHDASSAIPRESGTTPLVREARPRLVVSRSSSEIARDFTYVSIRTARSARRGDLSVSSVALALLHFLYLRPCLSLTVSPRNRLFCRTLRNTFAISNDATATLRTRSAAIFTRAAARAPPNIPSGPDITFIGGTLTRLR